MCIQSLAQKLPNLNLKGKPDGNAVRPSFIEEARCHLEVSLVIEYSGNEEQFAQSNFVEQLQSVIATMKVAGRHIEYALAKRIGDNRTRYQTISTSINAGFRNYRAPRADG